MSAEDAGEMQQTADPRGIIANIDDILEDTGLKNSNVVFATLDNARTTVGRWLRQETARFNKITGWVYKTDAFNWDEDYKECAKMCVEAMVKQRIHRRRASMAIDPIERATIQALHTSEKQLAKELLSQLQKGNPTKPDFQYYKALRRRQDDAVGTSEYWSNYQEVGDD